jgi:hypothetical protein
MSVQEQRHPRGRSKIKRGFGLLALTTLVFVTHVSSGAGADAVTRCNEIATTITISKNSLSLHVASALGDSAVKRSRSLRAPVVMTTGGPPMNLRPKVNSSINEWSPVLSVLARTSMAVGFQDGEPAGKVSSSSDKKNPDQVLEWNQIFIDTLIATNTPNSSSQRLGAIVHTAIFDAYNGIERRYTPIFVHDEAPRGTSRQAAVVAAAYTALIGLFPSRQASLAESYAASLAALRDNCDDGRSHRPERSCKSHIECGITWGTEVAQAVLAWRSTDGFSGIYPPFTGGTAVGQWRPTPPAFGAMSAQGLAFTSMFVLYSNTQFRPGPPRSLFIATYTDDFNAVKALGRLTESTRTPDQEALAPFWEGNASIHWNQAANQMARANHLSMSASNRLLAVLNIAMADTAITIWSAKRFYGSSPFEVTWRPVTSIPLAGTDGNPDTDPDPNWQPLVTTPSHPEYPAGHPSLNGAAATILLSYFRRRHQTFTLTTRQMTIDLPPRTYTSIAKARSDGNNARVWGGMHYPSTVEISDAVGEAIANYINLNFLQRLHRADKDDDNEDRER